MVQLYEKLKEPGSAATVQTLMGPSFRGFDHQALTKMNRSNMRDIPSMGGMTDGSGGIKTDPPSQPPTFR